MRRDEALAAIRDADQGKRIAAATVLVRLAQSGDEDAAEALLLAMVDGDLRGELLLDLHKRMHGAARFLEWCIQTDDFESREIARGFACQLLKVSSGYFGQFLMCEPASRTVTRVESLTVICDMLEQIFNMARQMSEWTSSDTPEVRTATAKLLGLMRTQMHDYSRWTDRLLQLAQHDESGFVRKTALQELRKEEDREPE